MTAETPSQDCPQHGREGATMSVRDPLRCSTCDVLCHNADSAQTHCLGGRAALAVALRDDRARVVAVTARIIQRAQEREREQP